MNLKTGIFSFLLFLSFCCVLSAQSEISSFNISGNVEAHILGEYTLGHYNYAELSFTGLISLNNLFSFRAGAAYGKSSINRDINTFLKAGFTPFVNFSKYISPLCFSFSYIYNSFLDFDVKTHSIFPVISYNAKRFGTSLGMNFRLSSFFDEKPQFEPVFSFSIYCVFVDNDKFNMGIIIGNFNDFHARNLNAIWLNMSAVIRFNKTWSMLNEIELMQSGIDGLTTTFYGISYKGGVRFSW